jgi:hypothetical protein
LLLFATGCPQPRRCSVGFIGDRTQPVAVEALITDGIQPMLSPIAPGQAIPLERPPQGGFVLYVGARVRNADGCGIELRGELFDVSGVQAGSDGRTTNLLLQPDGSGEPDPTQVSEVANVSACPDTYPFDITGHTFTLRMTVTDRGGRRGSTELPVVPTCDPKDPDCFCLCRAGWQPGMCGGPPDAGP